MAEGQAVAAVDLGSNSFHMIVARYHHGELQIIDRLKEMVRIAAGVDSRGRLEPEVSERALACLARFGQRLRDVPSEWVRAVGTNTMRRLHPKRAFLTRAEEALGHPIDIISGLEEARLIYHGVFKGLAEHGRQRLIIDIGGGSTEFVIGQAGVPVLLESLQFGCVRVSEQWFAEGRITRQRWQKAVTAVELELNRIAQTFCEVGWDEVIGSSGTALSVAAVARENGLSDRWLTLSAVEQIAERVIEMGHVDAVRFSGLSTRRQPVFAGGLAIVEACFRMLNLDQLRDCEFALREGLLYEMVGQSQSGVDPRNETVLATSKRFAIDEVQAQRVARSAATLGSAVAESWALSENARTMLRFGAQLHEIGLSIAHSDYDKHGSYLLRHADLPGFSRLEQHILALMVANHRRKTSRSDFDALPDRTIETAVRLSALLRLAVLLNRTRGGPPLPPLRARASGDALEIHFPEDWLAAHPLTDADLQIERQAMKRLGIDFDFS